MAKITMTKLMKFHTVSADPSFYWENNKVAIKLRNGELKTFQDYKDACRNAGCSCYNEELFNDHINGVKIS